MPRRSLWPVVSLALLPALAVYMLALAWGEAAGLQPQLVVRDLALTTASPPGMGLIATLGYLLWVATAAITLFTACARLGGVRGRERQLLISGGVFSLLLAGDDLFQLHIRYINEGLLYGLYAVAALVLVMWFHAEIRRLDLTGFSLAVGLLGASVLIDLLPVLIPIPEPTVSLLEDGLQFLGIACWLAFWWRAAAGAVGRPRRGLC